jgi:hypothetical protein
MLVLTRFIWLFILLVTVQVALLNNIRFSGYVNPFIYPVFILFLPVDISKNRVLLIAFFLGFIIDIFSGSPGLHAAALCIMAYVRPLILKLMSQRDEYEPGFQPNAYEGGFYWFLSYAAILLFIHHFFLFFIEVLSFSGFFQTVIRLFVSFILSLILLLITHYLFYNPKRF